jgi:hypothetical protein
MLELDLSEAVRPDRNVLAIRLVLRDATDGLVDNLKIVGSFALNHVGEDGYELAAGAESAAPASWTQLGFPFFSGKGVYRLTARLAGAAAGEKLFLEVPMFDDVVELEVNRTSAGVRLWDPYVFDVTDLVKEGENEFSFRVANTPANMLNGNVRDSGLAGAPKVYRVPPSEGSGR